MNSMLEYNGYHAVIEFDAEDELFIGEVFGIVDSLNFHGKTVDELVEAFHNCIDNYLDICKQCGKEPDKEFKGSFNVRIPIDLHRKVSIEATKRKQTLNQYVVKSLEDSLNPIKKEIIYMTSSEKNINSRTDTGLKGIFTNTLFGKNYSYGKEVVNVRN